MPSDNHMHHRCSIRLKGYDYSKAGLYFITICVQDRACLLGKIGNGQMVLNDAGRMVESQWLALPQRFANVRMHEFVVMPNHFHGILEIVDPVVGATLVVAPVMVPHHNDIHIDDVVAPVMVPHHNDIYNDDGVAPVMVPHHNDIHIDDVVAPVMVPHHNDIHIDDVVAPVMVPHHNDIHIDDVVAPVMVPHHNDIYNDDGVAPVMVPHHNDIHIDDVVAPVIVPHNNVIHNDDMVAPVMVPHHNDIHIDDVVAPNHDMMGGGMAGDTGKGRPQGIAPTTDMAGDSKNKNVGNMMDAFKSISTVEYIRGVQHHGWQRFNGKLWQRNYYEHIIRDDQSYQRISKYIHSNPAKWEEDKFQA